MDDWKKGMQDAIKLLKEEKMWCKRNKSGDSVLQEAFIDGINQSIDILSVVLLLANADDAREKIDAFWNDN